MGTDEIAAPVDNIDVSTALDLIGRGKQGKPAPMACCPRDGEPLISTFEFPKAEFFCQVCKTPYGFLSPSPKEPTDELDARHAELQAQYDVERAERKAAQS